MASSKVASISCSDVQMTAAVRMALYHLGQLQRAGMSVKRFWQDGCKEVDTLCDEMLQQADRMEPAPKLLQQV